jgi:hypothetical protein
MPPGFQFPVNVGTVDLWTTIAADANGEEPMTAERGVCFLNVIARMRPGVSLTEARADMNVIAERLAQQYPDSNGKRGAVWITPELEMLHCLFSWARSDLCFSSRVQMSLISCSRGPPLDTENYPSALHSGQVACVSFGSFSPRACCCH